MERTLDGTIIKAQPIKLVVDNTQITSTNIVDKNKELYNWWEALNKDKMLPNQENYNKIYLGKINRKEENKMIESLNLVDLYFNKNKENIEKNTEEKISELRKKCDVIQKYIKLSEQFEKDCDELYLSQFTDEEKKFVVSEHEIDDRGKQLRRNLGGWNKYAINDDFTSNEQIDVFNDRNKKINELNELIKTIKAHVGIAKTKEEVEEILTRYGILDKKGKLVTK